MAPEWYPLLFAAGLAAGFVDSIAGGGGLITLPVLLSAGLSPTEALGTNKLQASFGSGSAAWHFAQARLAGWKEVRTGMAASLAAAMAGAAVVQQLPLSLLRLLIPVLLAGIALFLLLQPGFGAAGGRARLGPEVFGVLFGLLIGFYDGFFGPGTGTFWAMAGVLLLGLDLVRSTAQAKAMNFASNAGALLVFLATGQIWFGAGLLMGAGQWLGARLGSRLVIRKGARLVRHVLIIVALVLALTALVRGCSRGR
jgi:uncharacterized protein